jgi:hypothetical protein
MEQEKKSDGALVGLIIIIIILVVGGLYMIYSEHKTIIEERVQQQKILEQNASELEALQKELSNTDTNTGVDTNTIK